MIDYEQMVVDAKESIIEESFGDMPEPEKQAVVFTRESLIEYLREEHGDEVEESYDLEDEENRNFETADELWAWLDCDDLQEEIENYTAMDVFSVTIDNVKYWIGNIDKLEDTDILDYALWYNEDYYENE